MQKLQLGAGRRVSGLVIAFGAVAALLILVVAAYRITASRDALLAAAGERASQLSRLLESGVSGVLQTAEVVADLLMIEDHFSGEFGGQLLIEGSNQFAGDSTRWALIQAIGLIDSDGKMTRSVGRAPDGRFVPGPRPDLSGSESFQFHRQSTRSTDRVFLSKVLPGISPAGQIIFLSKGKWSADGTFQGVVSVAVRMDAVEGLVDGLFSAADGAIFLFRADGTLLMAVPDLGLSVGQTYPGTRRFATDLKASATGIFDAASLGDGIERRLAYHVAPRYPFMVTVGLPLSDVLADWERTSIVNGGVALIAAVVIVLLTLGLAIWTRRLDANRTAILRSERRLAESQRISGLGHFERELTSREFEWSPNMYAIHGVDPAVFKPTHQSTLDLFIPEDRPPFVAIVGRNFRSPGNGDFEARVRCPDGTIRHIRYEWRLADNGFGQNRVFGVALDVSELRAAERGRRENELRLADILECSSDYVWETNSQGVFSQFSGAGVDLFHSPIGLDGSTLYLQTDENSDLAELEISTGQRRQFRNLVVPARASTGGQRWVRISGNPRFGDAGEFLGYRGAGTDVTEQRRQIELLEAQRKGEALGRLASGLAHEINNLLQPVMIYASAGLSSSDRSASAEQQTYFGRILRSAEQASSIVRNVLSFARRSPPNREDVVLPDLIRATLDLTRHRVNEGITVVVEEGSIDQVIRVDRTGLSQAIINLLTNAAEAMNGVGVISISAEQVAVTLPGELPMTLKPGLYCRLKIKDSGPGIPAENLNRIFDPFFTTKPQSDGTGLGLSIVSGLAKSWGGGIAVANDPAGGAIFSIYMPAVVRQAEAAQ